MFRKAHSQSAFVPQVMVLVPWSRRPASETPAQEGQETIEIDGETFILAKPIKAEFALVNAKQADYLGNLVYNLTARNFNPMIAMAAETVIAEAQTIVPTGALAPDLIATPHVLVDFLVSKECNNE